MAQDGGLRAIFRKKIPEADWQSIESAGVGAGIPDANYCLAGVEGWCEFKLTSTYAVGLRPEQHAWISRRVRTGGRVLICTRRVHEGGVRKGEAVDELWIHAGRWATAVLEGGLLGAEPLYRGEGGVRGWDWIRVKECLVL